MKKQIKKYGDTLIINFTSEEVKIYGLKVGDLVDVEIDKLMEVKK